MTAVVLFRFRLLPRNRACWLIAVNLAGIYFISHTEGQVVVECRCSPFLVALTCHRQGYTAA